MYLALIFMFLLGTHKGFLALWPIPGDGPEAIYPCAVHTLPAADQEMLAKGIPVYNAKQLAHLLEDYLS